MLENKEAKRVIWQILLLYLASAGIFLAIFFHTWYEKLYEELILSRGGGLKEQHRTIITSILNDKFTPLKTNAENIAKNTQINFAILDKNETIFSNLSIDFRKATAFFHGRGVSENKLFFIAPMSFGAYYLRHAKNENEDNALRLIIEGDELGGELFVLRARVISVALCALFALGLIAFFIIKIALRPMEEKIKSLNAFIKDCTHEINTPLSIILMSAGQLGSLKMQEKMGARIRRIQLAAKSLHQIYSDLVFYNFENKSFKEELDFKNIILERLEYFKIFFEQKNLNLIIDLSPAKIFADASEITRMIDNLLSNAIKYNKLGGAIKIILREHFLELSDEGCGIKAEDLGEIFKRYSRFNEAAGGFGIGLFLVKKICEANGIKISCESEINKGSKFILRW